MTGVQHNKSHRTWFVGLLMAAVLIVTMSASLGMYELGRQHSDAAHAYGAVTQPNRVDLTAWVSRIDATAQTVTVEFRAHPRGDLATAAGYFRSPATLYASSAIKQDPVTFQAARPISTIEVRFPLRGTFTDYPFDHYRTTLSFAMVAGSSAAVPVATSISSDDSFFRVTMADAPEADPGSIDLTMRAGRSSPTLAFAVFLMILMLGLAVAAGIAAFYVLRWRRGLVWPACSMMGAILFALVPLRNVVPGSPPIGSIIDFLAYFPSEAVISVALVSSVVIGYHVEIGNELKEKSLEQETIGPEVRAA